MPLSDHQFKPGNPGRPAGYINGGRKYNNIAKELDALGFDWVKEAVRRYRDPETPSASKDYCLGLITDRVAPKLKAIEITGANQNLQQVLINIVAGDNPTALEHIPSVIEDNPSKSDTSVEFSSSSIDVIEHVENTLSEHIVDETGTEPQHVVVPAPDKHN